ncbi:MAG: hypothetical protein WAZ19_00465 [Anaerolineae bacterium]
MIHDFDDFCLWMHVIIDDIWQEVVRLFKRPGPESECSDSELITIAIVGECRRWDMETELLSNMRERRHLFPVIPSQSRFNRRRRNLSLGSDLIRRTVLRSLGLAQDSHTVIDSLPISVVEFHLVPSCTSNWAAHGVNFGKVPSKKQTIFGYKLHLLISVVASSWNSHWPQPMLPT